MNTPCVISASYDNSIIFWNAQNRSNMVFYWLSSSSFRNKSFCLSIPFLSVPISIVDRTLFRSLETSWLSLVPPMLKLWIWMILIWNLYILFFLVDFIDSQLEIKWRNSSQMCSLQDEWYGCVWNGQLPCWLLFPEWKWFVYFFLFFLVVDKISLGKVTNIRLETKANYILLRGRFFFSFC